MTELLLVVNLHGSINASAPVRKALEDMKVSRKFSASVMPSDETALGMLHICKDRLSWSAVDTELLSTLLEKRGMVSESKRLDQGSLKAMGYKNYGDLAKKMFDEKARLSAVQGVRPFFRLSPPKGGFKRSMRRQFSEKGLLGRNPQLGEIVRRMV
jgi:large subunit ribosomal protein L30